MRLGNVAQSGGCKSRLEVRAEEAKYHGMGITSVPTFIIKDKFTITGGQPVETFVEMLNEIVAKETVY